MLDISPGQADDKVLQDQHAACRDGAHAPSPLQSGAPRYLALAWNGSLCVGALQQQEVVCPSGVLDDENSYRKPNVTLDATGGCCSTLRPAKGGPLTFQGGDAAGRAAMRLVAISVMSNAMATSNLTAVTTEMSLFRVPLQRLPDIPSEHRISKSHASSAGPYL